MVLQRLALIHVLQVLGLQVLGQVSLGGVRDVQDVELVAAGRVVEACFGGAEKGGGEKCERDTRE